MIILPSRGRPTALQRFFDQGKPQVVGTVILDAGDSQKYDKVVYPDHWRVIILQRQPICQIFNQIFEFFPDEPFYGLMGDDIVPETSGWDLKLKEAAGSKYIAWGDDGINQKPTHPFIGGDLGSGSV